MQDSRDNAINAHSGRLVEISSYLYTKALGSTFHFLTSMAFISNTGLLKKNHILAMQNKVRFSFGEVPLDMSTAGGDDIIRGYPKNRFRNITFRHTTGIPLPVVLAIRYGKFCGRGGCFQYC